MKNEEYYMQIELVEWLKHEYPSALFTIAPSGMKLPISVAVKLKRMGYKAGTPDIMIFEPARLFHGLFIELKTAKGVVSKHQKDYLVALRQRDYKAEVCWSVDEAKEMIKDYFNNLDRD